MVTRVAKGRRSHASHDTQWMAPRTPASPPDPPLRPGDATILAGSEPSGWAARLPRRPWVVVECLCGLCEQGGHVALDVPRAPEMLELYPESGLWTHVRSSVLRRRGEASTRQADAWCDIMAYTGLGNRLGVAFENNDPGARVVLNEAAALALCDSLGSVELTDDQARQLDWWREQRGGELTPEQLEQVREWQRERSER